MGESSPSNSRKFSLRTFANSGCNSCKLPIGLGRVGTFMATMSFALNSLMACSPHKLALVENRTAHLFDLFRDVVFAFHKLTELHIEAGMLTRWHYQPSDVGSQ
ncbi:TPA: hypothetical protein OXN34_001014 [Acinetobacter baumannii]|nr:hypothetical protein [Acinetobacter baumannii]